MYEQNGETFFDEFRGSFSGVLFDKKKDIKLIYTDHIGSKQVFYSHIGNSIILGSEINYITDLYKENDKIYTLNKTAVEIKELWEHYEDEYDKIIKSVMDNIEANSDRVCFSCRKERNYKFLRP